MATVKVKQNVWGNYNCFIGASKETAFGCSYDAKEWLANKLAEAGTKLSEKSDITVSDLQEHQRWLESFVVRRFGAT